MFLGALHFYFHLENLRNFFSNSAKIKIGLKRFFCFVLNFCIKSTHMLQEENLPCNNGEGGVLY